MSAVYALSVVTHMPLHAQRDWLTDIAGRLETGGLAILSMVWLYSAYFGLAYALPNPVIAQKLWTIVTVVWFVSCAWLLLRRTTD